MKPALRSSRELLLVAVLLASSLLLASTGCSFPGSTDTTSGPSTTPSSSVEGIRMAASDLKRMPGLAPQADITSAAQSISLFGTDLYTHLATEAGNGNLVFSPVSIATALGMTYAGAAGTTAEEMAATLRFELQGNGLHQALNSLDTLLESRSWMEEGPDGKDRGVLVRTANSLWAQRGLEFQQGFLDKLATNYGAGVRLVDYETAAEAAREAINQWVSGQTEDKITDLIREGVLDALTRLVLVNAVYLDATWAQQFDPADTSDGEFTTLAGNKVTVPMMRQSEALRYAAGEGWQAVELPYLRDELAMLIVVPDSGNFAEVETSLSEGLIDLAVDELTSAYHVTLTMPKFEFRTQASLNVPLISLGMISPFDPNTADFSAMTTEERLFVSEVIHEAYIQVDEEGTEAAAATAVVMELTAAMPSAPMELNIDRPFLFAIRDSETGAILFLGRVTDPGK